MTEPVPVPVPRKLDTGKAPVFRGLLAYFPRALEEVAKVSKAGADKYGSYGTWVGVENARGHYRDALGRHLLKVESEGPIDKETGCLHEAMIAWNALAALELLLHEKAIDRPA